MNNQQNIKDMQNTLADTILHTITTFNYINDQINDGLMAGNKMTDEKEILTKFLDRLGDQLQTDSLTRTTPEPYSNQSKYDNFSISNLPKMTATTIDHFEVYAGKYAKEAYMVGDHHPEVTFLGQEFGPVPGRQKGYGPEFCLCYDAIYGAESYQSFQQDLKERCPGMTFKFVKGQEITDSQADSFDQTTSLKTKTLKKAVDLNPPSRTEPTPPEKPDLGNDDSVMLDLADLDFSTLKL